MIVTRQPVLKRFWYPVMPLTALADAPVPFVLLGEKLVLWKTKDGVACLKDRCCHRTAKLSLGYLEDGNVVCGYHGWTFDGAGECVRIPQQPDQPIPKKARVDAYKTEVKYGYVWVALDEPLTGIPDFLEAGLPGFRQVHQFYETWDIGALRLMENSFDSAHVAFRPQGDVRRCAKSEDHGAGDARKAVRLRVPAVRGSQSARRPGAQGRSHRRWKDRS